MCVDSVEFALPLHSCLFWRKSELEVFIFENTLAREHEPFGGERGERAERAERASETASPASVRLL